MDRFLLQQEHGQEIPPKTVYLIRHGESTHNARAFHADGADMNDARYIDAALSARGVSQAKALRSVLPDFKPELLVTSPMTRATQTCLHATSGVVDAPIVVNPLCTERLAYSCDIGSAATKLRARFPMLDYGNVEDIWWWTPGDGISTPHDSLELLRKNPPGEHKTKYCAGVEPVKEVQNRVNDFRVWLLKRPENCIAVFAHGIFNRKFLDDNSPIHNCEVRKVVL